MKQLFTISFLILCALDMGAQAMSSLLIPSDALTTGRAGTTVAAVPCAYALEANPAAMSFHEGHLTAEASYALWQPKYAKDGIISVGAMGKIGDKLGLGLGVKIFNQPSYNTVDVNGITQQVRGTFTPRELSFSLGASYKILDCLSTGVSLKLASSSLAANAKAMAFAADIALAFSRNNWNAGLSVCNLGSRPKYGEKSYSLPTYLRAGSAYSIAGVTAQAEFDYLFSGAIMAGISAEYWYKDYVAIRAGYHYGDNVKAIPSYASIGLSGQFKGVQLDFAYIFAGKVLQNGLSVSLGYRF